MDEERNTGSAGESSGAHGVSDDGSSVEDAYQGSGTDVSLRTTPPDVDDAAQTGAYPTDMADSTFGNPDAARTGEDASTMYAQDLAGLPIEDGESGNGE